MLLVKTLILFGLTMMLTKKFLMTVYDLKYIEYK